MSEDTNQKPEVKTSSVQKLVKSGSTSKSQPRLPWWVELLFVQIGLPDRWLPKMLEVGKSTKSNVINKSGHIYYLAILALSLFYLNPLVRQANFNNKCISEALSSNLSGKIKADPLLKTKSSIAYKYCNSSFYSE